MNCSCGQGGIPYLGNCAPCFKMAMASRAPLNFAPVAYQVAVGFLMVLLPFLALSRV